MRGIVVRRIVVHGIVLGERAAAGVSGAGQSVQFLGDPGRRGRDDRARGHRVGQSCLHSGGGIVPATRRVRNTQVF